MFKVIDGKLFALSAPINEHMYLEKEPNEKMMFGDITLKCDYCGEYLHFKHVDNTLEVEICWRCAERIFQDS